MKMIVAGGRDYRFTEKDKQALDALAKQHGVTEVVEGGAPGADACTNHWAIEAGIPVRTFTAKWSIHGKKAGPIRNRQMAEYARPDGIVALLPGGDGTESMADQAEKVGLKIYYVNPRKPGGKHEPGQHHQNH